MENPIDRFAIPPEDYDLWEDADPTFIPLQQLAVKELKQKMVRTNCLAGPHKILELGCGTGITTQGILSSGLKRIELDAIDPAKSLLDLAIKRLGNSPRVTFREITAERYLYLNPLKKWDAVIAVLTIHNIPREVRGDLIAKVLQHLYLGGNLIVGDKVFPDDTDLARRIWEEEWIARLDHFIRIGRPDLYQFFREHEEEDWENRLTDSELDNILREAGFTKIHYSERMCLYKVVTAVKLA